MCIIEYIERRNIMKKLAIVLSLVIIVSVFFTSCASIETRYTGKRIPVDPADYEYEYRDYGSRGYYPYDYYDPYYDSFYGPSFGIAFSFWNPFWYYGILGSYYWGYSPYYWGYSPYYWGSYYPYYYGRGYGRSGYSPYRSNYRYYIRKGQLSKGSSYRSPSVRTKSSSTKTRTSTGIRSRSLTPTRSTPSSTRTRTTSTRTRTSSKATIKKKK
jgi:hypothetical protein